MLQSIFGRSIRSRSNGEWCKRSIRDELLNGESLDPVIRNHTFPVSKAGKGPAWTIFCDSVEVKIQMVLTTSE